MINIELIGRRKGEKLFVKAYAKIDDDDFELVNKYRWNLDSNGYVVTVIIADNNKKTRLPMHRLIMNMREDEKDIDVDHINHDRTDNRKENLRRATRSQNNMNNSVRKNKISKYKGVMFDKYRNKWKVRIKVDGKEIAIGRFNNEIEAARAYDIYAEKYFGEFANTNKIDESINPNFPKRIDKISKYLNVTYDKRVNKWRARKTVNGHRINLGYFKFEYDAYLATLEE